MTKKEVLTLVDECAIPMLTAMSTDFDWKITWGVKKKSKKYPERGAEILHQMNYKIAEIIFFSSEIESRDVFLKFMRHELLHLCQSGFSGFWNMAMELIPKEKHGGTDGMWLAVDDQFHRDREHDVIRMERMLNSLGLTPKRILAIGKKKLKEQKG